LKNVKSFGKTDPGQQAVRSQSDYRFPGYAEYINELAGLYAKYSRDNSEYSSMVNRLSDKYHIDTAQIV
jgi:hypothetical protein